jgi:hypothetical protein
VPTAGAAAQARHDTDQALAAARHIADDEDRDLVLADLQTIPGQPRCWSPVRGPGAIRSRW